MPTSFYFSAKLLRLSLETLSYSFICLGDEFHFKIQNTTQIRTAEINSFCVLQFDFTIIFLCQLSYTI